MLLPPLTSYIVLQKVDCNVMQQKLEYQVVHNFSSKVILSFNVIGTSAACQTIRKFKTFIRNPQPCPLVISGYV